MQERLNKYQYHKTSTCNGLVLFICLFVCFGFIVPLVNFSFIWRRHHYRWKVAADLYSPEIFFSPDKNMEKLSPNRAKLLCAQLIYIFYYEWHCSSPVCQQKNFRRATDLQLGERLQILTNTRHSTPLSSESSSACHNYCDTRHQFKMVMSEDWWHSQILPSVKQWSCVFLRLRYVAAASGIRTTNLLLAGPTL